MKKNTEKKLTQTKQALKESKAKFQELFENAADAIFIGDIETGILLSVNKAAEKLLKLPRTKIIGLHQSKLHPPKKKEFSKKSFDIHSKTVNTNNGALAIENTVIDAEGTEIPVEILASMVIFEGKKCLMGTFRDISERKKNEELHLRTTTILNYTMENAYDLILSIDSEYKITTINTVAKDYFKTALNADVKIGDNVLSFLPPSLKKDWKNRYDSALKGKNVNIIETYQTEGGNLYFNLSICPIFLKSKVIGVSIVSRDITTIKQAEEKLKVQYDELKKTNFELDSFVYSVSHDLRAPLVSIIGLVNIAEMEVCSENQQLYLSKIKQSANKLDFFIRDVLEYSRNSRTELKIEKINFKSIIPKLIDSLSHYEHKNKITITTTLNNTLPFYTDRKRLEIIFNNLISNAIKFIDLKKKNPTLTILIDITKQGAKIVFKDNGIGIHEKYIGEIFKMFYRASEISKGSGLGLYITSEVVQKLNGTIKVNSKYGKFTKFELLIPNTNK